MLYVLALSLANAWREKRETTTANDGDVARGEKSCPTSAAPLQLLHPNPRRGSDDGANGSNETTGPSGHGEKYTQTTTEYAC